MIDSGADQPLRVDDLSSSCPVSGAEAEGEPSQEIIFKGQDIKQSFKEETDTDHAGVYEASEPSCKPLPSPPAIFEAMVPHDLSLLNKLDDIKCPPSLSKASRVAPGEPVEQLTSSLTKTLPQLKRTTCGKTQDMTAMSQARTEVDAKSLRRDPGIPSDEEVVEAYFAGAPVDFDIFDPDDSKGVFFLSDRLVVKQFVSEEEVRNQMYAYKHFDSNIIRVPKVYRHFRHNGQGFAVMERLSFQSGRPQDAEIIAKAIRYMHTFESAFPGPVGGGLCQAACYIPDIELSTREDLDRYYDARISKPRKRELIDLRLELGDEPLVFCHMDVYPGNMGILADSEPHVSTLR